MFTKDLFRRVRPHLILLVAEIDCAANLVQTLMLIDHRGLHIRVPIVSITAAMLPVLAKASVA